MTRPYGYNNWNGPYVKGLTAESIDDFYYENNGSSSKDTVLSIR
ncbi:hypothetical protein [Methylotuvimicrobium sp. KM1]